MKEFNREQIEFIKDNYGELVETVINQKIDNDSIYYSDIEDQLNRFSNIVEALNGNYTMSDLYEDMYEEYYGDNFEDIAEEVYNELDSKQQQEIDELNN